MKAGDKVIINPNIEVGTWNETHTCTFVDCMAKPGVFTLHRRGDDGTFLIDSYWYDEEWLLPVPLFQAGDTVNIKKTLSEHEDVPYGVALDMLDMVGEKFIIKSVRIGDRKEIEMLGDDGCLYYLKGDDQHFSWSTPMFDLSNYLTFKALKHESRLQDKEAPFGGASGKITSGLRCRIHKARVTIQSLSHQEILGRG